MRLNLRVAALLSLLGAALARPSAAQTIALDPAWGIMTVGDTQEIAIVLDTAGQQVTAVQAYLNVDPAIEIVGGVAGVVVNAAWDLVGHRAVVGNRIELAVASSSGGCLGSACEVARLTVRGPNVRKIATIGFDRGQTLALTATHQSIVQGYVDGSYQVAPALTPVEDFAQGSANGWIGGTVPGFGGTTSLDTYGLCMDVPGLGSNFVLWVSPESYIQLVHQAVFRVRAHVSTSQQAPDAIPLFFFTYDNFFAAGGGNNFGGAYWALDVDGDAEGIGRPQGRATFDFYFAPNAFRTPQWLTGAFTPAADPLNDIRLQFRVIDAHPTLLSDNDSGTICVSRIEIARFARESLSGGRVAYGAPISTATHFAEALDEVGIGGSAQIDDATHSARYQLATVGSPRKTLGPYDPSAGVDLNSQLFPVPWEGGALYRIRARIRAESSEANPVGSILLAIDTATVELGMFQYATRGAPGMPMDRAASPKLVSAEYEAYLFSQNATLSMTPNAGRLRPLVIFFNRSDLDGPGAGGDAFIVETLDVDQLPAPP